MEKVVIKNLDPKTTSKTLEMILFDLKPIEITINSKDLIAELLFSNENDANNAFKLLNFKKILKNIVTASLSKVEKSVLVEEKPKVEIPEKKIEETKEEEKVPIETKIAVINENKEEKEINEKKTDDVKDNVKKQSDNNDVSKVLDQLNQLQVDRDEQRERLGEIIYPIARDKFPGKAAKITGMLIDAIQKLVNQDQIEQILHSNDKINILVNFFKKFLFNKNKSSFLLKD